MSSASPSTKRKMTRQFARTVTAQKPFEVALKRVQVKTWNVHIHDGSSGIETRENVPQLFRVLANQTAEIPVLVKAFQSLVADRSNHVLL